MDLINTFSKSLGDYNNATLQWVQGIVTNATLSVGIYIVGILLMFEIVKMYEKANFSNNGNITIKMFQGIAFRSALAGIMVAGSSTFLSFLMIVARGFVRLIGKNANGAFDVISLPSVSMPDSITQGLGGLASLITNPANSITYGLAFVIGVLVSMIAYLMIAVIVLMRFFQLYIMLALAPIPMASFASEEYSRIGKDYLKRIGAYAFQPAVILIVMGVYHFLSKITIDFASTTGLLTGADGVVELLNGLVMGIVFIIVLWQTHRMSSNLFGV